MKKKKNILLCLFIILFIILGILFYHHKANESYSYEWVKVEDSAIGQYKLYVNNAFGNHIDGTVRLVFINGKTKKVEVDKEGLLYVKDVVSDVRNPMKR